VLHAYFLKFQIRALERKPVKPKEVNVEKDER
jgi:hypothetical protein